LSIETVKQRVATVLRRNPNKAVMVWGDQRVPYGEVVILMSELQAAGAGSVGLVTDPPSGRQ
jgi:biopolymer transport protein TolR